MFDRILLPVDLGHDASWAKAAPIARNLLSEGGTLHVLGVVPDYGEQMVSSFFPQDFRKHALDTLGEHLAEFVAKHAPGAERHVAYGHIAEAIIGCAKKIDADVIVMASHPPDDLRSFLVGSQAEKVVRHSPVPVFVSR